MLLLDNGYKWSRNADGTFNIKKETNREKRHRANRIMESGIKGDDVKKLKELTLKEYTDLKRSGLMWVIFPEAIGNYQVDCIPESAKHKKGTLIVNGEKFDFEYDASADDIAKMIKEKTGIEATIEIMEPEKPLIVKDGKTYVAYWEGVNYLWTGKEGNMIPVFFHPKNQIFEAWKSFTGENPDITELTDELALLRPMLIYISTPGDMDQLFGVKKAMAIIIDKFDDANDDYPIDGFRLATTQELQKHNE